jgi:hypothetical protein
MGDADESPELAAVGGGCDAGVQLSACRARVRERDRDAGELLSTGNPHAPSGKPAVLRDMHASSDVV